MSLDIWPLITAREFFHREFPWAIFLSWGISLNQSNLGIEPDDFKSSKPTRIIIGHTGKHTMFQGKNYPSTNNYFGSNSRERGTTLIEAVRFSTKALGIVIRGIVYFEQASVSARTNDSVRGIVTIQSQVRALFQSQAGLGTANVADLLIAG